MKVTVPRRTAHSQSSSLGSCCQKYDRCFVFSHTHPVLRKHSFPMLSLFSRNEKRHVQYLLVSLLKKSPLQHNLFHILHAQLDEGKITDVKGCGFNKAFDQTFHDSHVEELEKYDSNKSNWLNNIRTQRVLTPDQCKLEIALPHL